MLLHHLEYVLQSNTEHFLYLHTIVDSFYSQIEYQGELLNALLQESQFEFA